MQHKRLPIIFGSCWHELIYDKIFSKLFFFLSFCSLSKIYGWHCERNTAQTALNLYLHVQRQHGLDYRDDFSVVPGPEHSLVHTHTHTCSPVRWWCRHPLDHRYAPDVSRPPVTALLAPPSPANVSSSHRFHRDRMSWIQYPFDQVVIRHLQNANVAQISGGANMRQCGSSLIRGRCTRGRTHVARLATRRLLSGANYTRNKENSIYILNYCICSGCGGHRYAWSKGICG